MCANLLYTCAPEPPPVLGFAQSVVGLAVVLQPTRHRCTSAESADAAPGLDANVTSLDLASLGQVICSMAVTPDGICLVCTASGLFAITKSGMQSLLAGHRTETGFTDGQGSEARFNHPQDISGR